MNKSICLCDLCEDILKSIFSYINPIERPMISRANSILRKANDHDRWVRIISSLDQEIIDRFQPPFCWNSDFGFYQQGGRYISPHTREFFINSIFPINTSVSDFILLLKGKLSLSKYFKETDLEYKNIMSYISKQNYFIYEVYKFEAEIYYLTKIPVHISELDYFYDSNEECYQNGHLSRLHPPNIIDYFNLDKEDWCQRCKMTSLLMNIMRNYFDSIIKSGNKVYTMCSKSEIRYYLLNIPITDKNP